MGHVPEKTAGDFPVTSLKETIICALLGNGGWIPGQDSGKHLIACSGGFSTEPSYVPDILQLQSCILPLQMLPSHSWHASDNCFFFCYCTLIVAPSSQTPERSVMACIKGLICPVFCLSLSCFSQLFPGRHLQPG